MAWEILSNKKNTSVAIHANSNTTLTIAGSNSVSNVAITDEVLTGATISQVWSDAGPSGYWIIKRGANVVSVHSADSYVDYAGNGISLSKDKTGTLVLELVGTANGYIIVEMQKQGTLPTTY